MCDPPYNTGNDFVYADDFAESTEQFLARSGQTTDDGVALVANPQSNGRFHSDWLSMMFSRLRVARNLLSDDGVMLVSIDDAEGHALRLMMDEVFGAKNFIGTFIWKSRQNVDSRNASNLSNDHEYVHIYARQADRFALLGQEIDQSKYTNPDGDARGPWMSNNILGLADARRRPNLHYPITDPDTGRIFDPPTDSGWRYGQETMASKIAEGRILFPRKDGGRPREKLFMRDLRTLRTGRSSVLGAEAGFTLNGTREVKLLLGAKHFDFPKPLALLQTLLSQVAHDPQAIVLDFFAGSGTTAQAVMQLNAVDGGTRTFICVQVAEVLDPTSDAARAGFNSIADLSRERLRRAGRQVVEAAGLNGPGLDVGFRALRVDSSNMADVLRSPDATEQQALVGLEDSVKPGRSGEDLLFQVLLDWGLEATLPISLEQLEGREVFVVDDGALVACFDDDVTPELVRALAKQEPLRAVFRDSAFVSDDARINAEQIFKELSPSTDVKAI